MRLMRFVLGVLLSVLLLGVATLRAQTNPTPGAAPASTTFLVMANGPIANGGYITIYPLKDGVPQNPSSPYSYFVTGEPSALSVDSSKQWLYATVGNEGGENAGKILGYKYTGENGFTLSSLPGSPFKTPGYSGGFGLAPDYAGSFLYAANEYTSNISGFQINNNGSLGQQLSGSPFSAGEVPFFMAFDATDGFLYCPNYNTVSGYQVNATTGTLTPLPGSPYTFGGFSGGIAVDSVHNLLYVSSQSDQDIWVYTITSSGALVPASGSPVPTGGDPYGVAISPAGDLLYVNSYSGNSVYGYHVNTSRGALTPLSGSPFPTGFGPEPVIFDPTGTFLYVGNSATLSAFHVGPSGALTPLPGSPYTLAEGYTITMVTVTLP
jgi:DNA-binding beta-propeller fold protein YncE